jgi:hypothetical protein
VIYQEKSVLLYHHWDGYPEGVGFDLIQRQRKLKTWDGNVIVKELLENKSIDDGYEKANLIHTDLDYWYEIDCNKKTIRCWKVKGCEGEGKKTEVIKDEEITFIPVVDLSKKENKKDK